MHENYHDIATLKQIMSQKFGTKNISNPTKIYEYALNRFNKVFKTVEKLDEATEISLNSLKDSLKSYRDGQISKENLEEHFILAVNSLNLDRE